MHRVGRQQRVASASHRFRFDPWRWVLAAAGSTIALFATLALLLPSVARAEQGDPDQAAKVSTDVNMSLQTIKPGTYRLLIQNQSGIGSIDSFAWVPGPGWRVTSVTQTSQGTCVVVDAALACNGKIQAPKQCTCQPGGQMSITFRMVGPPDPPASKKQGLVVVGTVGGYFVVKTVTLTNHHIPTELPNPNT
jgi:hypothetical protein